MRTRFVIRAMDGISGWHPDRKMKHIRQIRVAANEKRIPPPYGRVSALARLLYGLTKYTKSSPEEIRRCMGLDQKQIDALWKEMRVDENFKYIIKGGLPAMYGESLPEGYYVLCLKCNHLVNWVPCVRCCNHTEIFVDRSDKLRRINGEEQPPESDEPTMFLPGSEQKVAVMKFRVEMGFQPFCSGDAKGAKRV